MAGLPTKILVVCVQLCLSLLCPVPADLRPVSGCASPISRRAVCSSPAGSRISASLPSWGRGLEAEVRRSSWRVPGKGRLGIPGPSWLCSLRALPQGCTAGSCSPFPHSAPAAASPPPWKAALTQECPALFRLILRSKDGWDPCKTHLQTARAWCALGLVQIPFVAEGGGRNTRVSFIQNTPCL